MITNTKTRILTALFILVVSQLAYSTDNAITYNNELSIGWNSLIIGNTVSVEINRKINDHLAFGLNFSKGNMAFEVDGNSSFLFTDYGRDMDLDIQINHIFDIYINYIINNEKRIQFFNSYKLGLTHINFSYENNYFDSDTGVLWTAKKNISRFGIYFEMDIIKYYPKITDNFGLTLGLNVHYIWLKNPVIAYEYSSDNSSNEFIWNSDSTAYSHIPLPMLFFKMAYRF